MVNDQAIYVVQPDVPAGMTLGDYRRLRPRHTSWWRRWIGRP